MFDGLWIRISKLFSSCFSGQADPETPSTPSHVKVLSMLPPVSLVSPGCGIKFKVAKHNARPVIGGGSAQKNAEGALMAVWDQSSVMTNGGTSTRFKELFQSSLGKDVSSLNSFLPQRNGFVDTVLQAYNQHHKLIIRPDDLWIAILSQLNAYVNANAEDLRSYFVSHEGQKELVLVYNGVTRYTMDFSLMARDFAGLLQQNINDPTLYDVIQPGFSTTTKNDVTICSVIMMSIMKAYFSYTCVMDCGIPSVTLLGTKADYESILNRLEKLDEMGSEARAFTSLLRPIIKQFIATFDALAAGRDPNMDFWGKICHEQYMGSGPLYLSGWLTAFCVWNADGKWQGPKDTLTANAAKLEAMKATDISTFDASVYGRISMDDIPVGFADVPVKLIDNGLELSCMMVAGHVGARVSGSGVIHDTLQPEPHWFMFEVETA